MADYHYEDHTAEILARIRAEIPLALEEISREFEHHARQDYVPVTGYAVYGKIMS